MISSEVLDRAIATYNEYRSPMATAELIDSTGHRFTIRFTGPFSRMCCDYDYFEDFIYELPALGIDVDQVDVAEIRYTGGETFEVEFSTQRGPSEPM